MKLIIVVAALVAVAVAAPSDPPQSPQIVKSEYEQKPDGGYVFGFQSDDGIERSETGELKEALDEENQPHSVVVVKGFYSYTDPDGNPVLIKYFADETGYHAEGDTIPVAPSAK